MKYFSVKNNKNKKYSPSHVVSTIRIDFYLADETKKNIRSNLSLHSLYYTEACNELAGPISTSLLSCNSAPFKEMLQR